MVLVYGVNQGVGEGWAFFAQDFYLSDPSPQGLGLNATQMELIGDLATVPWHTKALYGIASDVFGSRAPFIALSGMVGMLSWFGLSVGVGGLVSLFLMMGNFSIASPDVMIDASIAEKCVSHPELATSLQTLCWASFGVGKVFALFTAPLLYHWISSKGIFAVTVVTSFLIIYPSRWVGGQVQPKSRPTFRMAFSDVSCYLWD